jgi:hypothetical protein
MTYQRLNMKKSRKWFYSFLSNWDELKQARISGAAYATNLAEMFKLCVADMGKSWAKRVYRLALKEWNERKKTSNEGQ